MNISVNNFSYAQKQNNINFEGKIIDFRKYTSKTVQNRNFQDGFEKSKDIEYLLNVPEKTNGFKTLKKAVIAGITAIAAVFGTNFLQTSNVTTIPYNSNETKLSDVAKTYGISEKSITAYNKAIENDIEKTKELKIPLTYDYISEETDKQRNKLYSKSITEKERQKTEKVISALEEKQKEQKSIAQMYTDDKFVYFTLDLKNTKSKLVNQTKTTISAENFKQLFDIPDGVLKDYNDLPFKWMSVKKNDIVGHYADYSLSTLKDGNTYKVPKDEINKEHINIDRYIQK